MQAAAKVNLYLHITGKRQDGYHTLNSLAVFSDFGDEIKLSASEGFSVYIDGPFARMVPDNDNLVIIAAKKLSALVEKPLNVSILLTKNIPAGAGLGGGSSDAAATIKALLEHWSILPETISEFDTLLLSLGADVPACFYGRPCFMNGIGEKLQPVSLDFQIPAVLVYPNVHSATAKIFEHHQPPYTVRQSCPDHFKTYDSLLNFLNTTQNDLTSAAINVAPEIEDCLTALKKTDYCKIARMTGSGSACFGLFDTPDQAQSAASQIRILHPDWWVKECVLNSAQSN